jgi:hypothetical protein
MELPSDLRQKQELSTQNRIRKTYESLYLSFNHRDSSVSQGHFVENSCKDVAVAGECHITVGFTPRGRIANDPVAKDLLIIIPPRVFYRTRLREHCPSIFSIARDRRILLVS